MLLRDALLEASARIARREAETLLTHVLDHDRPWLLAHPDESIDPVSLEFFRALISRRAAHEPLQYLTGHQEFFGLPLRVTPDVLIPRPETEHLVEAVLAWAHQQSSPALHIADIGTGSGAIALALAVNLPHAEITAVDLSPAALAVARNNAGVPADRSSSVGWNAGVLGLTTRIRFLEGDLLAPLQNITLDAVVSNPPYVPETDAPTLAPEVRDHEPALALFAGPDGLSVYRRLLPQAFNALRPGGLLALEIGFGQRAALTRLLEGWKNVRFVEDYASIPRIVLATRP